MIRFTTIACALALVAAAGCGGDDDDVSPKPAAKKAAPAPAGQAITINAKQSGRGAYRYDMRRISVRAGKLTIHFNNNDKFPHNVRIQNGSKCCFGEGQRDVGGTTTIDGGAKTTATVTLKPGNYVFLCSIGGHWNGEAGKMHGKLVVR